MMTTIIERLQRFRSSPWRGRVIAGLLILVAAGLAVLVDQNLSGQLCNPSCYVVTAPLGEEENPPPGHDYYDDTTDCWSDCPP